MFNVSSATAAEVHLLAATMTASRMINLIRRTVIRINGQP
jgi:hypothetical protein